MVTKLSKGTPVISLADGVRLGTIDHVYFDPALKQIVGFSFQQGGGLFGAKTQGLIDISDVHAIGPDAVTIHDLAVVRSQLAVDARGEDLIDLEAMLKREVVSEGGTQLGVVTAVQFGEDSHRLTSIQVASASSSEPRLIAGDRVKHIGPELVVVADAAPAVAVATAAPAVPRVRLLTPDREEHPIAEAV